MHQDCREKPVTISANLPRMNLIGIVFPMLHLGMAKVVAERLVRTDLLCQPVLRSYRAPASAARCLRSRMHVDPPQDLGTGCRRRPRSTARPEHGRPDQTWFERASLCYKAIYWLPAVARRSSDAPDLPRLTSSLHAFATLCRN